MVATEKLTQPPDSAGRIDCVLEESDGYDTRSTCGDAGFRVVQRNAADRQNRYRYRAADFAKTSHALRRAKRRFGRRCENRAEEDVIGALVLRGLRCFDRMARNADEERFIDSALPLC